MQPPATPGAGVPAAGAATAVAGAWAANAVAEPLRQFVFDTARWLRPRALALELGTPLPAAEPDPAAAAAWQRLLARVAPPRRLDPQLLTRDLRGRLALLPREDWLRLGLCVSVLPSCGQIQRSMDGHFRRVVRQLLDEPAIQALDHAADLPAQRPVFLAGPGAWRTPDTLAAAGVRAAMAQACPWPDPVALRVRLHFEPEELDGPPSVGGLDMTWLEIACKALWPDHPWLWS